MQQYKHFRYTIIFLALSLFFNLYVYFNIAYAASFKFVNTGITLPNSGCSVSVDIQIELGSHQSNAADIEINYNPNEITIVDSDSIENGIQIKPGNAYESYFYNQVFQNIGKIKVAGMSLNSYVSGIKKFATIEFIPQNGINSTTFTITFNGIGNTLDSNIAEKNTNVDLLNSVVNGTYYFGNVSCNNQINNQDVNSPIITFINPYANNQQISPESVIIIKFEDYESGIDLNSTEVKIENITFYSNSAGVQVENINNGYIFIINPNFLSLPNQYSIYAKTKDKLGNNTDTTLVFETVHASTNLNLGNNASYSINQNTILNSNSTLSKFIRNLFLNSNSQNLTLFSILSLLASILPLLVFTNLPLTLLNLLLLFAYKKRNSIWGIIVDEVTRMPIPFVTVRIYNHNTLFVVAQSITDLEGRYGFFVNDGKYRIEIVKDGYEHMVYDNVQVTDSKHNLPDEIYLKRADLNSKIIRKSNIVQSNFTKLLNISSNILLILGIIFGILSIILDPNILNIFILFVYILIFYFKSVKLDKHGYKPGSIIDSTNGYRIPFATIKVFNLNKELVDIKKTNSSGFFDFYLTPGFYLIDVIASCYKFPSKMQLNNAVEGGYLQLYLKRGGNYINILLDPMDSTNI
ncbi:MAG: carboxypeptidase regulatory-like domain-containing protein [Candidatus Dojkabacteria bacterium]|nr:carboxypeptidase regulatory-like domain-containing protein [Candidatus Dojkabacteria bacterium]